MDAPVFLKYSLLEVLSNSSSVSISVFRIEWDIHRPLSAQRRACCFTLPTPLMVQHSCYVLNELVIGAIPQRSDLLKEWIDSGTVVPVFLWAGSPSSTPSKISRRKKNQLAENSKTKKPLLQALALLLYTLYSLEHSLLPLRGKEMKNGHYVFIRFYISKAWIFKQTAFIKCSDIENRSVNESLATKLVKTTDDNIKSTSFQWVTPMTKVLFFGGIYTSFLGRESPQAYSRPPLIVAFRREECRSRSMKLFTHCSCTPQAFKTKPGVITLLWMTTWNLTFKPQRTSQV